MIKGDRSHPKGFVHFIMEAIDEVAPGRGTEIYWLAFNRYEDYAAQRQKRPIVASSDEEWSARG